MTNDEAKMTDEWNALPKELQKAFMDTFSFGPPRNYRLKLSERGGLALLAHLKKHGLEICLIK